MVLRCGLTVASISGAGTFVLLGKGVSVAGMSMSHETCILGNDLDGAMVQDDFLIDINSERFKHSD